MIFYMYNVDNISYYTKQVIGIRLKKLHEMVLFNPR